MNAVGSPVSECFFRENAPFTVSQRHFLNGLFLGRMTASPAESAPEQAQSPLSILFASQTGTAEALAKKARKLAANHGFAGNVAPIDSVTLDDLAATKHLLLIAATSGEGEPPDNAQSAYRMLMDAPVGSLPATLNYSVCGLGDTSYAHFNKVANELDKRLTELGATRATPVMLCDADYDADYESWRDGVFASPVFESAAGAQLSDNSEENVDDIYTRKRPFLATLLDCRCLSSEQSAKKVNHIELSLASGCEQLNFEVGDALGLWPLNDMADVNTLLRLTRACARTIIQTKNGPMPLLQALHRVFDLVTVTKTTAELWNVDLSEDDQLIDVLTKQQPTLTPQQFIDGLRPLQPRLYSISSSPSKHPGEVHLTVGEVHYNVQGHERKGVASTYLGNRLVPGSNVGVYVQKSSHFSLPESDETPLIMIGPGTGIAPFRAFLEEREQRKASGKNWLFFGDQHENADYLYKEQICEWQETGLLNRLSLAWSRDNRQKVYVQHLIEQEGEAFFSWLEQGAAIYVCGDASRMAVDVEQAIVGVISKQGDMKAEAAVGYLEGLRKTHRYQRDVY